MRTARKLSPENAKKQRRVHRHELDVLKLNAGIFSPTTVLVLAVFTILTAAILGNK
jgi:hypothetical protein